MTRTRSRRGGTPALVLCLFLALGSVLLAAATFAAAANAAAERDYCRSQALALAEAGIAEARVGAEPHGPRPLGRGVYSWSEPPASGDSGSGDRTIVARGEVVSASGARVTRTVRATLQPTPPVARIIRWEERP